MERSSRSVASCVLTLALGHGTAHAHAQVYLNLERKFAFVEFKTIELTTACLALDGASMHSADV